MLLLHLAWAQPPAPTLPAAAPPTVPSYSAPAAADVLAEKSPLRLSLATRKGMVAWKGTGAVRAVSVPDSWTLYQSKADEQVGLVRAAPDQSCWLRQNGQNFCAVPALIRLESDKPIKLWTPQPESWITVAAPLLIIPTADATFNVVQELLLEEYLRQVVPGEMPQSFHPQALRAQAIIARTYTLSKLGRHAADDADLCASEHCQVYRALTTTRPTDDAVKATRGMILLADDKIAVPYYHAHCGGATDDAGYIWGPLFTRPYLVGGVDRATPIGSAGLPIDKILTLEDPFCKRAPSLRWTKTVASAELDALVRTNLAKVTGDAGVKITHVTNLAIEERTLYGRASLLRVEGDGASHLVRGDQIRWLFGTGMPGPNGLWSTLFELTLARDATGALTGITLNGTGRGHGIGLCQWGADGRAQAGQSFRQILQAYYPGLRLGDAKTIARR
jgi:SpoIID/LytB domain protein